MFDAFTLAAVLDEVRPATLHGRVQRVLLLDELSLGLEIYAAHQRHQLVISAHPRDARLHLASARLTADRERVTPFLLLLRKYVRGGQVVEIVQPPLERTVTLSIVKRLPLDKPMVPPPAIPSSLSDDGPSVLASQDLPPAEPVLDDADIDNDDMPTYEVVVRLIVEIMGRHSNIVLVDGGGAIMDSIKRVPASVNRYRTILPRRPYVAPPVQAKADPRAVDSHWWRQMLARSEPARPTASVLVDEFRGISPQVGREIAMRAAGQPNATLGDVPSDTALPDALASVIAILDGHEWAPHVYRDEQRVVAFSPFALTSLATLQAERVGSVSAAVEAGVGQNAAVTGHGQSRSQLLDRLAAERDRLVARRTALADQLSAASAADKWRHAGETIFAYMHSLTPGQTRLDIDGTSIVLDPLTTPVANAQRYFDRYRRARAAAANVPDLIAGVDLEIAYLDQVMLFAQHAETLAELQAIEVEWRERSSPPAAASRSRAGRAPRRLQLASGERVLIGRNGRQNDEVTFDLAGPDDLWLHARGLPGAHVILQPHPGRAAPNQRLVEAAAQLAAYYSPARAATAVEVDVTARRWVRKVKGGPPGLVTYRNEITVRVAPAGETALRERGLLAGE